MVGAIEKRHHKRINDNTRIVLESLLIGIDENSRMFNRSDFGLYFESDQFLQPGSEIFIRLEKFPQSQTETYQCHHAKVLWGKRLNKTRYTYGYGVKFVETSNKQNSQEIESDEISELRRYPREYCDKPATFVSENKSYDGFISDISRNGCFLENLESLNIGQIFDLVIPGTKFSKNNTLKVEVVRLSPIGVGVKFKRIIKKSPK